jgi:hypothetical protein
MAVNKVEINGETKLDLTQDTVTPKTLLPGVTAHNAAGDPISGAAAVVRYDEVQSLTDAQKEQARENIDAAPSVHEHDNRYYTEAEIDGKLKDYLPLTGGTITGNLTGKYISGTWLQTTATSDLGKTPPRVAVLDDGGWMYSRTPAEILSDIDAAKSSHNHEGRLIQPTSIELFPGTSAGHGGYIDFHFNSDAADFTSRIYEPAKGVLKYNGQGIVSTANIIALYNVHVSFSNGLFEYSNAAIKTTSVCFAQFRGSAVSSGFQDTVLGVTSYAGKLRIIAKNGGTFETDVNILIVNL